MAADHRTSSASPVCEVCYGRGWYIREVPGQPADVWIPDTEELYCECEAGKRRKERET